MAALYVWIMALATAACGDPGMIGEQGSHPAVVHPDVPGVEMRPEAVVTGDRVTVRYEVFNGGDRTVVVMASADTSDRPVIEADEQPGVVEIGERVWGGGIIEFPRERIATPLSPGDTFRKEVVVQRPLEREVPYPGMKGSSPFPEVADAFRFCVGVAYPGEAPTEVFLGDGNRVQHEIRTVLAQRLFCTDAIPLRS